MTTSPEVGPDGPRPWGERLYLEVLFERRRRLGLLRPVRRGRELADWLTSLPSTDRPQQWTAAFGLQPNPTPSYTWMAFFDAFQDAAVRPSVARSLVTHLTQRRDALPDWGNPQVAHGSINSVISNLRGPTEVLHPELSHPHGVAAIVNFLLPWLPDEDQQVAAIRNGLLGLPPYQLGLLRPLTLKIKDKSVRDRVRHEISGRLRTSVVSPLQSAPRLARFAADRAGMMGSALSRMTAQGSFDPTGQGALLIDTRGNRGEFARIDAVVSKVLFEPGVHSYAQFAKFARTIAAERNLFVIVGDDGAAMAKMARFLKGDEKRVGFLPTPDCRDLTSLGPQSHSLPTLSEVLPAWGRHWLVDSQALLLSPNPGNHFRELTSIDDVAEYAEHDPFVVWGAQDLRNDARAWAHEGATAVLSRVLWKQRLFVRGEPRAATALVRHIASDRGLGVQRVWAEAGLADELIARLPWLEEHETTWMMSTRQLGERARAPLPEGSSIRWHSRSDQATRRLLSKALSWSYSRTPAPVEEWVRVYSPQGRLASVAALSWPVNGVAFPSAVATEPSERGHGYGSRAVREVVQRGLAANGQVMLVVDTGPKSAAARRIYEEMGMSRRLVKSAKPRGLA